MSFVTSVVRGNVTTSRAAAADPGARPDLVLLDAEEVQDAQQHVRRALRVVREHEVTIPLNVPSMPPTRITGTFSCACRCELPMLLPL